MFFAATITLGLAVSAVRLITPAKESLPKRQLPQERQTQSQGPIGLAAWLPKERFTLIAPIGRNWPTSYTCSIYISPVNNLLRQQLQCRASLSAWPVIPVSNTPSSIIRFLIARHTAAPSASLVNTRSASIKVRLRHKNTCGYVISILIDVSI